MVEILSWLYLGHNYRGHKGIYFLTINGRRRTKLSHQHCSEFQLHFSIMLTFSLQLPGTACGHMHSASGAASTVRVRTERVKRQSHRTCRA